MKRRVGVIEIVFASFLLVSFVACDDDTDDHDHEDEEAGPPSGATCPKDSDLTYDNFGKDFVATYCLSCHSSSVKGDARHGAPGDHNFDKLSDVALFAEHIDEKAASGPDSTNTSMPPASASKKPSMEEREKLGEWLACGAP